MKKSLIALGLAVACVLTAAEKKDYSQYLKVASDLGTGKSGWTMTSSYANATVKKLNLEVEPSEVKAAAIEYEINCNPYDPRTKTYVTKEDYHWGDIIVKVNNTVVYKGHAGKYISRKGKGIQRMDIDPKVLKAGENTISFVWDRLPKGDKRICGYIYFGVDLSEREIARRKIPAAKRPKVHNDDIRIRLLVNM